MHPEIWMPPEKEIHYFDLPKNLPFAFFLLASDRADRFWVMNRLKRSYQRIQVRPDTKKWYLRYCFLPRTDNWYKSLFAPAAHQIAGEATPHYATLNEEAIAKVHGLMPKVKIIYLLRNPIERMWSHAAMNFSERFGYQGIDTATEQALARFLRSPKNLRHARYFANLQRWEKYFPQEQIFIGYVEQISHEPRRLLQAIYEFIGVNPSEEYMTARAEQVIFGRDYPAMPEHLARIVAEVLIEDIERLHQHLNTSYTAAWLAAAKGYLEA
jgi:hypothetical protein